MASPRPVVPRKRRRGCDLEAEYSEHEHELRSLYAPDQDNPVAALSETNLREHDRQMNAGISNNIAKKNESLSEGSMSQDAATVSASQRSSCTLAEYRLRVLERANITVKHGRLPGHIRSRLDGIVQPEISEERRDELFAFADKLYNAFPEILASASREDDAVELICHTLESMNQGAFTFRRKIDWIEDLIPSAHREIQILTPPQRTSKRQKTAGSSTSRQHRDSDSAYPPSDAQLFASDIKIPRPNLTVGYRISVVTEKLERLGVSPVVARHLLNGLRNGEFGGVIHSDPTSTRALVPFPSLIVEGKSYSTGRSIYEAQNQALVSGSCMLNLQDQLAGHVKEMFSTHHETSAPLAFSLCTEGPIIQLWVHYTTSVEDTRFYNMSYVDDCNAENQERLREFLVKVEGVMRWAASEVLDGITEQLAMIGKVVK